ncbi:MAG: hypothetical protein PHS95_02305 [Candidatus Pacebacteria bacterium]|nr:hypothetical protein [Candidatus Paceibacterota bacterium]
MDSVKNIDQHQHAKISICVSGSADLAPFDPGVAEIAKELGREIARNGIILLTGATTGFPFYVAMGAKEAGGVSIGFSPASSEKEHAEVYKLPMDYFDTIVYTGFGYSGRNLLLTRAADAVIVGCGRIGTMNEFTIAFEDHKPIGVLRGSWSMDEIIETMVNESFRKEEGTVAWNDTPKGIVTDVLKLIKERKVCELGGKCPVFTYENNDGVGGKIGERVL